MSQQSIVVITGTSSGLGQAMARQVGAAGYQVVGIARRLVSPADLGLTQSTYSHIQSDLSQVRSIPALAQGLADRFGTPYGLINCAASGADGLLPTMHNSEILGLVDLNLTAPILMSKYVGRQMLSERSGRIINVSSIVARTGYRGLSVYAATKAALEGFSRSLARDLGPRGVTVNCVAPGFVETPMTATLSDANLSRIMRRSALGRFPKTDEVASAVVYLLSPEASAITGTVLTVDAGSTA